MEQKPAFEQRSVTPYFEQPRAGVRAVCPALVLLTLFDGVAGVVDRTETNPFVGSAALT
jgi:hypothetical protein